MGYIVTSEFPEIINGVRCKYCSCYIKINSETFCSSYCEFKYSKKLHLKNKYKTEKIKRG